MSKSSRPNPFWGGQNFLNQGLGMVAGGLVGFGLVRLFPGLMLRMDPTSIILLCALLGVSLASLRQYEQAGAALTRRDHRLLNFSVGLGVMVVLLIVVVVRLI